MNLSTNDVIKRARKSLGITQDEMANKLNMRRSTYAYKESKGSFTFDEVKIVSEVLRIPLEIIADPSMYSQFYHFSETKNTEPLRLESTKLVLASEDPLDGLITNNERLLLKGYRDLSLEAKEKLKKYLEELKNAED